jgi:hypothetical protein
MKLSKPVFTFTLLTLLASAQNPSVADEPTWWTPAVIDTSAAENNKGPANIGQAKHMVDEALKALAVKDPALSASIRQKLTDPQPNPAGGNFPKILDFTVPNPKTPEWIAQQKAPLLTGQLKAIAAPFYDALHAVDPTWLATQRTLNGTAADATSIYPWTTATSDDAHKAIATIGQLKAVFSLRFETATLIVDFDGDGLDDNWEIQYFGDLSQNGSGDSDGDGLTNLDEFTAGTNPSLTEVDGDGMADALELLIGRNPSAYDAVTDPSSRKLDVFNLSFF